jgi:hypothetical protein
MNGVRQGFGNSAIAAAQKSLVEQPKNASAASHNENLLRPDSKSKRDRRQQRSLVTMWLAASITMEMRSKYQQPFW